MPSQEAISRRTLFIFYVLDTSKSMEGDKIASLNEAMQDTVEVLVNDISKNNADAEIKIAILEFNSGATWITEQPIFVEDFVWNNLKAGGLTDIGMALDELNDKMSRSKFMSSDTGQYIPIIIFMSDGYPTDNWEKPLKKVKEENRWFQAATKIAFALGNEADENVLAKIVGNLEAVIKTDDLDTFKKLIKIVSATSSLVNGTSKPIGSKKTTGVDIVKEAKEQTGIELKTEIAPEPKPIFPEPQQGTEDPDPWGFGKEWNVGE